MTRSPLVQRQDLSPTARRLLDLLPGIYFARNERLLCPPLLPPGLRPPPTEIPRNEGFPCRPLLPLLEVLAGPLRELELAIEQLADDHFVERCSQDALEHLAELVGARILGDRPAANRGIIARTLHWRRRKGTAATLEEVLETATGWSTEVEEAYRSLLHTQDLANPVPLRGRTVVLWDPITLANPLSRRAPPAQRPRHGEAERVPVLAPLPDESIEDTLRRIGRADAERHAASPRTIDFSGWARPEVAVIRTSRFVQRELDRVQIDALPLVPQRGNSGTQYIRLHLDPARRDRVLVASLVRDPAALATGLTAAHEPDERPAMGNGGDRSRVHRLLTPTTLAADGDGIEAADNLSLFIDGVLVVGQTTAPEIDGPLAYQAAGRAPVLRLADQARPSPDETWQIDLMAIDNIDTLAADLPLPSSLAEPEPEAENPFLARTTARKGKFETRVSALAQVTRSGAQAALRLSRPLANGGYRRASDGRWEGRALAPPMGAPLSDLAAVGPAGDVQAVRLVHLAGDAGTLVLQGHRLDDSGGEWNQTAIDWDGIAPAESPQHQPRRPGPAFSLLADGDSLLLVGPDAAGQFGVWRISNPPGANATAVRLDAAGSRPPTRWLAAACLHQGALYLLGGEDDFGHVLGDLWSMPLDCPGDCQWQAHRLRERQLRTGGRLLSTANGLVLLGGATRLGVLNPSVFILDPDRPRPRWTALHPLPLERDAPGVLWARLDGDFLEVLAWSDRVWPQNWRLRLEDKGGRWQAGVPEIDRSPNPPAEGEVLYHADHWWVLGPAPLPPSEIVLSPAGDGHLIHLPALDLLQRDEWVLYLCQADGSSELWSAPGTEPSASLRLGAGRHAPVLGRRAEQTRLGAPGRLRWTPLKLRQRSLGPWDQPLALKLTDTVALDPRLGRVLLSADIGQGRFEASYRVGRSAPLGAGFLPGGARLDPQWCLEPEDELAPPDIPEALEPESQIWVSSNGAQVALANEPRVVATPAEAIAASKAPYVLGFKDSPRLPPQRLAIGDQESLSMFAAANGSYPVIGRDQDGCSLVLQERLAAESTTGGGPRYSLSGLMLTGALDLALGAGRVQLRWCDLGAPGELALRVIGSGHESALALRSIPESTVQVWLYGCVLGRIELPPWVQLIAGGCLIDGGGETEPAIQAAGARVRLRHCTIRGRTLAGVLEASSCAFQGRVHCDRPDLGWLRYCLLPGGTRLPRRYHGRIHGVSFASIQPTDPNYLVLAPNNGQSALQAGEARRLPGAHATLDAQLTELLARTNEFLPLSLVPQQVDRTSLDLHRMNRRDHEGLDVPDTFR